MFPFRIGVFLLGRPAVVRILLDIKESVDFISTSLATLNKRIWTFLPFSVISHASFNFLWFFSLNNHHRVEWNEEEEIRRPSCHLASLISSSSVAGSWCVLLNIKWKSSSHCVETWTWLSSIELNWTISHLIKILKLEKLAKNFKFLLAPLQNSLTIKPVTLKFYKKIWWLPALSPAFSRIFNFLN